MVTRMSFTALLVAGRTPNQTPTQLHRHTRSEERAVWYLYSFGAAKMVTRMREYDEGSKLDFRMSFAAILDAGKAQAQTPTQLHRLTRSEERAVWYPYSIEKAKMDTRMRE